MAKQRKKWVGLRWVQSNIRFTVPAEDFLHGLDLIHEKYPDVITLNEVGGRVTLISAWAHGHGYLVIQPHRQRGMADDQAVLLRAGRFGVGVHGIDKMHGEPPGAPTARYLLWVEAIDHLAGDLPLLMEAYHSLAAVERSNRLNRIARTRYYVAGNINLIRRSRELRKVIARKHGLSAVPVVLAGDINWSWRPGSWIDKTLGTYFTCCHTVLKRVATLGKRSVDIVAKRGGRVRFVRQHTFRVPSDHLALCVDLEVWAL